MSPRTRVPFPVFLHFCRKGGFPVRDFENMNPAAVTVHLLLTACITIFCMEPLLLGISMLCGIAFFVMRNGTKHIGFHIGAIGMPLLFALLNPLWNQHGTTVLFFINQRAYTAEALFYGCVTGIRLCAVLYWFRSFSDLMTSEKLFYLFRFLSPKLALVFSMAVRNLTLFRQQMQKIRLSQRAVGLYPEGHLIDDIRGELRIFSILLTWALENGIITANSMAARGYGIGKRTSFTYFRWHAGDFALLICALLLSGAVICGIAQGVTEWQFYPVCEPAGRNLPYFAVLAAYAILALLPIIHEGKETLTWKRLQSEI